MFFLVYVSSAAHPLSKPELLELLNQCRKDNARLSVTGMLLYKDGNIMQVLEGEEPVVRDLYQKVQEDPRHHGVTKLIEGPEEKRQFPDWSMGFRDLNSADVRQLPGFNEFLNTPLSGAEFSSDPTRCQRLLMIFKRNM